ncbi:hypothetical protein BT96DRAFT_842377, partial [Gymnopus androsaceus JB14]
STVQHLCEGGISKSALNASKGWLTNSEAHLIIDYCLDISKTWHPLDHQWLKEHVDEICRSRLGSRFPEQSIGKHWTYHFVA